jgi:hypothetical protein
MEMLIAGEALAALIIFLLVALAALFQELKELYPTEGAYAHFASLSSIAFEP